MENGKWFKEYGRRFRQVYVIRGNPAKAYRFIGKKRYEIEARIGDAVFASLLALADTPEGEPFRLDPEWTVDGKAIFAPLVALGIKRKQCSNVN
ncbi:MAG: hypothetical protein SAMD01599839_05790 [Rectinema sp.]